VRVAGVTNTVRLKNSKKGDRYATFNIEDPSGVIEVIAWPRVYKECEEAIVGNAPVLVTGALEIGDAGGIQDTEESEGFLRKPQVIASEIVTLAEMRRRVARYVDISMDAARMDPSSVSDLKKTLALYPGDCRTYLKVVRQGASETLIELPDTLAIDPCDDLLMAVDKLLGPGSTALR
jgi:DNA polymerase-3 subunit alpha